MKPSSLAKTLALCIQAQRPAFIWGPPGVGKSAVTHQVTDSLNRLMTDIRAANLDAVDARGIPFFREDRTLWALPDFFPTSGEGVIFLDEFPQATPLVMNSFAQLILDRRIGSYVLPDGWAIVAAGNRETDRAATNRMPTHLKSRFVHLDFDIDHDDLTKFALENGWRTEVIAFLRFRPELLHSFQPNSQDRAFPCPRTWQFVSELMETNPSGDIELELYSGTVGEGAATEFVGFLRVFRSLPSPDAILLDPKGSPVPDDPATLYALTGALSRKATDANFGALSTYAGRLSPEFSVFLVLSAVKRCPAIQQTRAFVEWISANSNVLI